MTGKDEQEVEKGLAMGPIVASPDFKAILASAPSVEEVLGKPDVYRAWLAKAQEALNG